MNEKKINEAKRLAVEFVASVERMRVAEKEYGKSSTGNTIYPSPKHRGEVRRRSMDLTRALAEMRKPTYD